ncbi:MAG: DUF6516 family protein [Candidatus Hydrothermarchaeales archaeon]
MQKAERILSDTILLSEIEVVDIDVWRVPVSKEYPKGIRYSYNYRLYVDERWVDVVRWDNYHGARPHKDTRDPETGRKKREPDRFRTPDEVMDVIYSMRDEIKAKWKVMKWKKKS